MNECMYLLDKPDCLQKLTRYVLSSKQKLKKLTTRNVPVPHMSDLVLHKLVFWPEQCTRHNEQNSRYYSIYHRMVVLAAVH